VKLRVSPIVETLGGSIARHANGYAQYYHKKLYSLHLFFCFHHLSELFFSEFFMAVPSAALWQKNFYPD